MTRRALRPSELSTLLKFYLKTERVLGGYLIEARAAMPDVNDDVLKAVWYGFDAMETWFKESEWRGTQT